MKLDRSQAESHLPEPGIYLAEIVSASEGYSKSASEAMFRVTFKDVAEHKELCTDILMMEGKGARIGYKKLDALGIPKDQEEVVPLRDLVGKRVKVAIAHREYNGEKQATVDISAEGSMAGYFPVDQVSGDDTPF